jgi:DNA-binding Xre family transcriptional regulator
MRARRWFLLTIARSKVIMEINRVGFDTLEEVAHCMRVSPQTLSSWFRRGAFNSRNFNALCVVLRCQPADLLTFEIKDDNQDLLASARRCLEWNVATEIS